jgi:hypothetical protein
MAKQIVTRKPLKTQRKSQRTAPRKAATKTRKKAPFTPTPFEPFGRKQAPVTGEPFEVFGRKRKQAPATGKPGEVFGKKQKQPVTGTPWEVFGKKQKAPMTEKPWEVFGHLAIYGKPHKVRPVRKGRGSPVTIACVNKATVDLGVPFQKLTKTLQKCFDEHFLPVWGYPVKLYNTTRPKRSDWQFVYLDDADRAGALGYHKLTYHGQPISRIFVKTTREANELVSVTACHELFEMVIDPLANLWAEDRDGTEYAYEMSDPVEDDTFLVDGIEMSNFVYPSWFEPFEHPDGTKFDHLGLLKKPFSMTKGGYTIIKSKGKVIQEFGSKAKARRFAEENRRNHRSEYRKREGLVTGRAPRWFRER